MAQCRSTAKVGAVVVKGRRRQHQQSDLGKTVLASNTKIETITTTTSGPRRQDDDENEDSDGDDNDDDDGGG